MSEHCDGIEATCKLQILEVKLADLDRNNDSNSENGESDAVADKLAAHVKIPTASPGWPLRVACAH